VRPLKAVKFHSHDGLPDISLYNIPKLKNIPFNNKISQMATYLDQMAVTYLDQMAVTYLHQMAVTYLDQMVIK
jgi:hypothetical protein